MKGGLAGWLFDATVWVLVSTEIFFATNGRSGASASGRGRAPAYANITGAVVFIVQLDAHPAFCHSLGSFRSPTHYFAWGSRRELNRVKEGSHESMVRGSACLGPRASHLRRVSGTDLPIFGQGFRQTRRPARPGGRGPHHGQAPHSVTAL